MECKSKTGEPENFAVLQDAEFQLEWQPNRAASAEATRTPAPEEECAALSGPGSEYWLP